MRILLALSLVALLPTLGFAQEEESESYNFSQVESYPVMEGCTEIEDRDEAYQCTQQALQQHIVDNFQFPSGSAGGRVWVRFTIEEDGSVDNIEIERSSGDEAMDQEAIRVVKLIPDFANPAVVDGKPVQMTYVVPVNADVR